VNEFEEMLAIEEERAKERKAHGETAPGKSKEDSDAVGNVSQSDSPERAREKAAEKINADVSGRTLEKGKEVKESRGCVVTRGFSGFSTFRRLSRATCVSAHRKRA